MSVLRNDGWVPYAKSIGTAAVAAVVLAVSAVWLVQLAELCGIDPTLSWTLPVALDVGGGVATIVWTKSVGTARKWGMVIALLSLGESLVGNILSHLIKAGIVQVDAYLIIGVGAMYPITLFLMIHLLVVSSGGAKQTKAAKHAAPAPRRTEAVNVEQGAGVATTTRKPIEVAAPKNLVKLTDASTKRDQGEAYVLGQAAAGRNVQDITAAEVDRVIGANGYAKKHMTDWRAAALAATPRAAAVAGN